MPANQVAGLTPNQIADRFALPYVPTHVVPVRWVPGQLLRGGVAGPALDMDDVPGQMVAIAADRVVASYRSPPLADVVEAILEVVRAKPAILKELAPERYAEHWQITLDFLQIVTDWWPRWLEDEGAVELSPFHRLRLNIRLPRRLPRGLSGAEMRRLLATAARDLGAPLDVSIEIRERIAAGEIPGPRLFVSGPFLQSEVEDWQSHYRWAVDGVRDARTKVERLHAAGVDMIKLVDQDKLTLEEARAVVDAAHGFGLKVVGHSHRPAEIRRGLEIGVDNFEHTGLTTAPEYPEDVMRLLKERTARGRVAGGPHRQEQSCAVY